MDVTPSWTLVGIVLILIGLMVKFEVQVIDSDDQETINGSKEVKGQKEIKGHQ